MRICLLLLTITLVNVTSFLIQSTTVRHRRVQSPVTTVVLHAATQLPGDYQEYGNECIRRAASLMGASHDQIKIEWNPGRIIVTVNGNVYASAPLEDGLGEMEDIDLEGLEDEEEDEIDELDIVIEEEDQKEDTTSTVNGIDLSALARAINVALDDGAIGLAIAETHEIEVTTPGASEELNFLPPRLFNSYKGFDVIIQHEDPKVKKIKTFEGRLVERNNDFTMINIKGRMKNLKTENVRSIKLPKAKKEPRG